MPVIVPPAKTTSEVPALTVPAVYVQLWLVRIVPARTRVPAGLLMTSAGRSPEAVVEAPVKVCVAGAVDEQGAAAPAVAEDLVHVGLRPRPCPC